MNSFIFSEGYINNPKKEPTYRELFDFLTAVDLWFNGILMTHGGKKRNKRIKNIILFIEKYYPELKPQKIKKLYRFTILKLKNKNKKFKLKSKNDFQSWSKSYDATCVFAYWISYGGKDKIDKLNKNNNATPLIMEYYPNKNEIAFTRKEIYKVLTKISKFVYDKNIIENTELDTIELSKKNNKFKREFLIFYYKECLKHMKTFKWQKEVVLYGNPKIIKKYTILNLKNKEIKKLFGKIRPKSPRKDKGFV